MSLFWVTSHVSPELLSCAIQLLSQIVLIAAVARDFEVICPTEGCKYLSSPRSFKASLLQLSYGAYDASWSVTKGKVNLKSTRPLQNICCII